MRYSAAAIIDIKLMESNMMTLWRQVIAMMMPDISIEEESEFQAEGLFLPHRYLRANIDLQPVSCSSRMYYLPHYTHITPVKQHHLHSDKTLL
jgi:hypothetical protein